MKEVITLQIGGFGNMLGSMFFQDLYSEHSISPSGNINYTESPSNSFPEIFVKESQADIYSPRTVIIDSDPSLNTLLNKFPTNSLVPNDQKIFGSFGTQRNFAKGLSEKELIGQVLETCRKEAEQCESLQGFQLFHSIGGGTGSGLMSEVMNQLMEYDPSKTLVNFSCFPSYSISELPQESINACLALSSLVELSQLTVCLDNGKLFDSVSRIKEFKDFSEINLIMRQQVSDFTSFLRFPKNLFSTYQKFETFFTPFPRLHFLMMSSSCEVPTERCDLELMKKTLGNIYYQNDLENSRTYTSILLSRGPGEKRKEKRFFDSWRNSNQRLFVEWIKSSSVFHSIESSNSQNSKSFSYIQNSQGIKHLFMRLSEELTENIRGKVQIERYLKQGMDEMEFTECESNINDLCSEFSPCCCGCFEEEDSGPEDEEIELV